MIEIVRFTLAFRNDIMFANNRVADLIKVQYVHDRTGTVVSEAKYEQGVRLGAKVRRVNQPSSTVSVPPAIQSEVSPVFRPLPPFKAEFMLVVRPLQPPEQKLHILSNLHSHCLIQCQFLIISSYIGLNLHPGSIHPFRLLYHMPRRLVDSLFMYHVVSIYMGKQ